MRACSFPPLVLLKLRETTTVTYDLRHFQILGRAHNHSLLEPKLATILQLLPMMCLPLYLLLIASCYACGPSASIWTSSPSKSLCRSCRRLGTRRRALVSGEARSFPVILPMSPVSSLSQIRSSTDVTRSNAAYPFDTATRNCRNRVA
jgi:hypothetical protein